MKKEYILGENRIKILLFKSDNLSSLDFFLNDRLTMSIRHSDYDELVNDLDNHKEKFEKFVNKEK